MYKIFACGLFLMIAVSCTHGSVSRYPEDYQGDKVFTYQGRSNYSWQLGAADNMMEEKCTEFNNGKPVILQRAKEDLGYVVSANQNNFSASSNQNQIIKFKCEK